MYLLYASTASAGTCDFFDSICAPSSDRGAPGVRPLGITGARRLLRLMRRVPRYLSLSMYAGYLKRMLSMKRVIGRTAVFLVICAAAVGCRGEKPSSSTSTPAAPPTVSGWRADDEQYRRELEKKLTSDTGWLTIAGLAFMTEPETTVGSDPSNDVV